MENTYPPNAQPVAPKRGDRAPNLNGIAPSESSVPTERVKTGELEPREYAAPAMPMDVADQLVNTLFTHEGLPTLKTWRGDMWHWIGTHWQRDEEGVKAHDMLWHELRHATYSTGDESRQWAPKKSKIADVLAPLEVLTRLDAEHEAPTWVPGTPTTNLPPARRLVPMRNGLLDLKTRELHPHTNTYFNTYALEYDYDPTATCPTWQTFLNQIFDHDPTAVQSLQEFIGYILAGDNTRHKAPMIIGPARAGKGTISRTIQQLIGTSNVTSPSLHSLGSEFGMEPLIGKPLAIMEDARPGGKETHTQAVERLLNIIGQDPVSINRKNKPYWNGTLPTRFVLISNEVPRFIDSSNAISSRFIGFRLKQSFAGSEDVNLGKKLSQELPGIFNWALEGLERLNSQNNFTVPATHEDMQELMKDLSSPARKFIDEQLDLSDNPSDWVPVTDVFDTYKRWCLREEMKPWTRDTLGEKLQAISPEITFKNNTVNGKKMRRLYGVKAVLPMPTL